VASVVSGAATPQEVARHVAAVATPIPQVLRRDLVARGLLRARRAGAQRILVQPAPAVAAIAFLLALAGTARR
jgi:hypothetical protein